MARLVQVRGGWMYEPPRHACPAGHTDWEQRWSPCAECGTACLHWDCRRCPARVRDPDHRHDGR